jgi:hypothetical protein
MMGILDRVLGAAPPAPLAGLLEDIQTLLDRVRDPDDALGEDEALAAITRLMEDRRSGGDVYQKPWG